MRSHRFESWRAVLFLALLLTLPHATAGSGEPDPGRTPDGKTVTGIPYRMVISGVEAKSLEALLRSASVLETRRNRRPSGLTALEQRVLADRDNFRKVLRSEGYYAARVDYRIDAGAPTVVVFVDVDTGPKYRFKPAVVRYRGPGAEDPDLPGAPDDPELAPGNRARAPRVVEAGKKLIADLAKIGHPLARLVDRQVIVDHGDRSMAVTFVVAPGERVRFGPLAIEGANRVKAAEIMRYVPWQEGDRYNAAQVERLRERLLETGLFHTVAVEHPNEPRDGSVLPLTLRLQERKQRTISLGARYATDEGLSAEAGWEHRNLMGLNDRLSLVLTTGESRHAFDARYRKPHFLRNDQTLLLEGVLTQEDYPAYDGPLTRYFAGLERPVGPNWRIRAGVPLEYSNLDDHGGIRDCSLVGLEFSGDRDTADNRFDPTRGSRWHFSATPLVGRGDGKRLSFVAAETTGSGYFSPGTGRRVTLAGRVKLGVVGGADTGDLPANWRFYSGGDGVRGYAFQFIGPMSADGQPLGGRSQLELGGEVRFRLSETIGAVAFLEGGKVSDGLVPRVDEGFRWAAGLGLRYFTVIGPVRLDVAFPLNPGERDDDFQFYISIGQAF